MAESGARIPQAQTDDNEDISWALSTAEAMWSRGDLLDAIKWVRRAAEAAGDAEQDERALELAKAAADLQNQLGGVGAQAASQPPPPPPPPPPTPNANANAAAAAAAAASTLAAHSAVTAPPPDGSSQPPPAAVPSPVPPDAAITASPPSAAPSYPPPAPSFASGGRGPTTTSGTMKRPSSIPRPSGTPAAPQVARVSAPRPFAPRLSGAPPLPPAASASFAPPVPSPGLSSPPPLPNTTPSGVPAVSPPYFAPPVAPVAPASSMPSTARALEAADPASPASVPSEQEPTATNIASYASNHPSAPPTVHAPRADRSHTTVDDDPTATSHDLEPPEDTAQIDVPVAPRRPSSKAPPPPPPPPRPQLDTPSAQIDGSLVDATHTAEVRIARNPAEEIDAWPTQAIAGEDFADSNVSALVAALPPMRPREPSKHPMDPELLATQAVRVVVWRTPDGVRVAPAGTVVSAIACDAVLVALDPTADLSAWLTNKR